MAAIEAGLLPKIGDGYEKKNFEMFWELYGEEIDTLEDDLAREQKLHKFWKRKFIQAMFCFILWQVLLLVMAIYLRH